MNNRLDRSTLEAYVDGQLDPAAMREAAELLIADPEALAQARALHSDAALLRDAYREAAEAPVPPALLEAVDRGFARRNRRKIAFRGYAVAASVALALLGALAGYLAGEYRVREQMAVAAALKAEDQRILAATVEHTLERTPSGQSVAWRNPDSGSHGEVVAVRTYRSKSNHWCREYRTSTVTGGTAENVRAIACRAGAGDWVKVEQLYYNS